MRRVFIGADSPPFIEEAAMSTRNIIIVLVIIVLAVVAYVVFAPGPATEAPEPTTQGEGAPTEGGDSGQTGN